ncbi:WXG100 family type VII secretion target [Plantactinospora solaniradicis]|uniref:WXG100 family type VII secretion target n=1 Tax=Plantactinospora solaniradicis TaxID=1723736 RepID=A0ABW1KNB1_9ACTN
MTDVAGNPLVAARQDSTEWYTGLGLVESVADTVAGIESGSWIDATIGGVSAGLDALGAVLDPLGSLVSWGVAWLLDHVKPLSDALDWLAGDPDQITAFAQTWRNVAANSADVAAEFQAALATEISEWGGASAEAYRSYAATQLQAMDGIGRGAGGVGTLVEAAGLLVALVREMVRDLIADFVSVLAVRLPMWLAEAGLTLGVATPLVVAQVGSLVAKWVARIGKVITALITSLRRLAPMLSRLGDLIDELSDLVRRLGKRGGTDSATPPVLHSRSGAVSNRQVMDEGLGLPRDRETIERYAELAGVDLRGVNIEVIETPDDIAYLDFMGAIARTDADGVQLGPAAFVDEETLVRTLGHESIHVEQYREGRVTSNTGPLEDEAYASEDRFVEEWRRNTQ